MSKLETRVAALEFECHYYTKRATMAALEGNEAAAYRLRKLSLISEVKMRVLVLADFAGNAETVESLKVMIANLELS